MCGLVGVAGRINTPEKRVFRFLHWLDEIRGDHSTGLAAIKYDNTVDLVKAVGPVQELWKKDFFDEKDHLVKAWNHKVFIGHNRFATVGEKTEDNAHPFQHGDIVGAHNGTLTYQYLNKLDGEDKFEVDSEAIFYSINKNGVEKTIASLHGAWALVWFNSKEQTLNFIRNNKRPLYYTWDDDHKTLFWASEDWMLELALSREKIKHEKIMAFMTDHHYVLDVKGVNPDLKNVKLMYTIEKYEGYEPPAFQYKPNNNWLPGGQHNQTAPFHGGMQAGSNFSKIVDAVEKKLANSNVKQKENKPSSSFEEDNKNYEKARSFLNKEVEFYIYGERNSELTGIHLIAECDDLPNNWEIRLYADTHHRLEEWKNSTGTYKGRLKTIVNRWNSSTNKMERYLTVDLRSIGELIPVEEKKESTIILGSDLEVKYKGYGGSSITYLEMVEATSKGCVWCGEPITESDLPFCRFVLPERVACSFCLSNAKDYYGQY